MNELIVRYMRACVRASNPRDVHAWTTDDLADVFAAIPQPARSFPEWAAFRDALAPGESDPDALTEDQRESNQAFIDMVQQRKKETLDDQP